MSAGAESSAAGTWFATVIVAVIFFASIDRYRASKCGLAGEHRVSRVGLGEALMRSASNFFRGLPEPLPGLAEAAKQLIG